MLSRINQIKSNKIIVILMLLLMSVGLFGDNIYNFEDIFIKDQVAYLKKNEEKVTGVLNLYSESGQLSTKHMLLNGVEDGVRKVYFNDGKLLADVECKNGKPNGICRFYRRSGELYEEGYFLDGKVHGPYKAYYKSGKLSREANYENSKLNGNIKWYDESGALQQIAYFINDTALSGFIYYPDGSKKELSDEMLKNISHKANNSTAKKEVKIFSELRNKDYESNQDKNLTKSYLELYKNDFGTFDNKTKTYLIKNLKDIGRITQRFLVFPHIAVQAHQQGINVVEFMLYPDGKISKPTIIKSSTYPILDDNTEDTIRKAYRDYPRPDKPTTIRIYVKYTLI